MSDRHRCVGLNWAPFVIALLLGGGLLMLWPAFFAVFFAVLMLLQFWMVEQELTGMPWAGVSLYVNRLVFLRHSVVAEYMLRQG